MKTKLLASLMLLGAVAFGATPQVVPELKSWTDATVEGKFTVSPTTSLCINSGNKKLYRMARGIATDFGVSVSMDAPKQQDIVLTVDPALKEMLGEEGYMLTVTPEQLVITAATEQGVYWGSRSVLQVFTAQGKTFPAGVAKDWPDYPIRGFMFDCGRKPFTMTTLNQIVKIMSYYKLNDLQLHLSDNYIWLHNYPGVQTEDDALKIEPSAGGFRLESAVKGLTSTDISYTKDEFKRFCQHAAMSGVKIIPELDVPGHALPMVRVRPELMYRGNVGGKHRAERAAMLDLKNPETFDFIRSIFDEYLDDGTFGGDVVHIGTDEYYGDVESYRAFADQMLRHVQAKGKTPRLWGSLSHKHGMTPVLAKGVQMDIWALGWQNPRTAIEAGYDIINILDNYTYAVPSGNGSKGAYCDDIDPKRLYNQWTPAQFNHLSVDPKSPQLLGGAWALWSDHSFLTDPGLCGRDLLARIRLNCAIVAQKTWGVEPKRDYEGFLTVLAANGSPVDVTIPAWERTFEVTGTGDKAPIVLADSDETTLYAVSPVNGNVGFRREGAQYTFDYAVPVGKTVKVTFKSSERKTELLVDGVVVAATPTRQYWPKSCKFYTLPEPTK